MSVVIPTRGGQGRVWSSTRTFVVHAVSTLLERSTHADLEVVVVADSDTPAWVTRALQRLDARVRVLPWARPFNFSEKINAGVAAATGDLLLLLNDDTELIGAGALEALASFFADPTPPGSVGRVGVVGARLLFDDGTLQHAGHVYNQQPLHAFLGWPGTHPGPGHRLMVARECSGVTAAALMVDRATFDEVGGFPEDFPLDYNDVAFCLAVASRRPADSLVARRDLVPLRRPHPSTRATAGRVGAVACSVGDELDNDPYHHPDLEVRRPDRWERLGMPPDSAPHSGA